MLVAPASQKRVTARLPRDAMTRGPLAVWTWERSSSQAGRGPTAATDLARLRAYSADWHSPRTEDLRAAIRPGQSGRWQPVFGRELLTVGSPYVPNPTSALPLRLLAPRSSS